MLKVGKVVRTAEDDTMMTVSEIGINDGCWFCIWFPHDDSNEFQEREFRESDLIEVPHKEVYRRLGECQCINCAEARRRWRR